MKADGWEGSSAVGLLLGMRLRGRVRGMKKSLKRARSLLLLAFLVAFFAMIIFAQTQDGGNPLLKGTHGAMIFAVFVTVFFAAMVITAVANGVLAFTPAEIQFLFPAPVGTRVLLAAHLVTGVFKAASAAVVCAIFVRTETASILRAFATYFLMFAVLTLASLAVDLACIGVPRPRRRRWSIMIGSGILVVAAMTVMGTWLSDGRLGADVFRHLRWPGAPFGVVLLGTNGGEVSIALAGILALCALLLLRALSFKGNIRDVASHTSERVQKVLARFRSGSMVLDRPRDKTTGLILPMLPRLGGAGVHAWRQLAVLLRQRRSYVLLLLLCLLVGAVSSVGTGDPSPEISAMLMVVMISVVGPMYVQCDFRSDFENMDYLRSLPTPATVLAAGQMLASCLVLYAMQLVLGGWVFFVAAPERRLAWLGVFLGLPLLNTIQLSVENGAYLLFPFRMHAHKGPPGIMELSRMYALMLAKLIVMLVVLAVSAVPAILVWRILGLPVLAGILALSIALAEVLFLVYLVGRIFLRVDTSRDMGE